MRIVSNQASSRAAGTRLPAVVALALLLAGPALAQNRLANSGFEVDLSGWSPTEFEATWSPDDAQGSPTSGSVRVRNTSPSVEQVSGLLRCLSVEPDTAYDVAASIRLPPGQSAIGDGNITLFWFSNPDCNSFITAVKAVSNDVPGDWQTVTRTLTSPVNAQSVRVQIDVFKDEIGGELVGFFDDVVFGLEGTLAGGGDGGDTGCVADDTTLCLDDSPGDGRFQVEVSFSTSQGGGDAGRGHAISLSSLAIDQGGLFWFFDPGNPEMLLKVLRACPVNGHFWVFYSAGTNVGLEVTVTDTVTGQVWESSNPDGAAAPPVQDTSAFPCG